MTLSTIRSSDHNYDCENRLVSDVKQYYLIRLMLSTSIILHSIFAPTTF